MGTCRGIRDRGYRNLELCISVVLRHAAQWRVRRCKGPHTRRNLVGSSRAAALADFGFASPRAAFMSCAISLPPRPAFGSADSRTRSTSLAALLPPLPVFGCAESCATFPSLATLLRIASRCTRRIEADGPALSGGILSGLSAFPVFRCANSRTSFMYFATML
jgi:hypothetical protein